MFNWIFSLLLLFPYGAYSYAEFFQNVHYCEAPKVGEIYMGASAEAGNRLALSIDGMFHESFAGFKPSQAYKISLASREYEQYVVHVSAGKRIAPPPFFRMHFPSFFSFLFLAPFRHRNQNTKNK